MGNVPINFAPVWKIKRGESQNNKIIHPESSLGPLYTKKKLAEFSEIELKE